MEYNIDKICMDSTKVLSLLVKIENVRPSWKNLHTDNWRSQWKEVWSAIWSSTAKHKNDRTCA